MTRYEKIWKATEVIRKSNPFTESANYIAANVVDAIEPPCCIQPATSYTVTFAPCYSEVKFEVGDEVSGKCACHFGRLGKVIVASPKIIVKFAGEDEDCTCDRDKISLVPRASEIKKFKVGDRVKYVSTDPVTTRNDGQTGSVIEVREKSWYIKWDAGHYTSETYVNIDSSTDRRKRQHVKPTPETYFVPVGKRIKSTVDCSLGIIGEVQFGEDKSIPPKYRIVWDDRSNSQTDYNRRDFTITTDRRK